MIVSREDLTALRIPLIALAATLIAAVTLIYVSASFLDGAHRQLTQRERDLRAARLRIQNAGEEKEMISRYLRPYRELERAGFVGEEQRINWLDSLRMANEQARIFGVEYDIGAQAPYAFAKEFNAGQLLLHESVMHLRFRLLHEEDLLRFFDALHRSADGYFTVDQCVLRRVAAPDQPLSASQPNLNAECDLRWLTVKPPPPPEKKG